MSIAEKISKFLLNGQCVFLEASAGTGKTTTLVQTVKILLEKKILLDEQKILLLTFTEKATLEIQEKLISHLEKSEKNFLHQVQIKTIDSFFLFILKNFFILTGVEVEDYVSEEIIGRKILEKLFRKDWLENPWFYEKIIKLTLMENTKIFLNFQELYEKIIKLGIIATDLGYDIQTMKEKTVFDLENTFSIENLTSLKNDFFNLFESWHQEKEAFHEKTSLYSFSQAMRKVTELAKENQKLLSEIKKNYAFVFIDEFQDTNQAQWEAFERLFIANGIPICTVGDPKQSIYEFRGADLGNYLTIRENIKNNNSSSSWIFQELKENYRSSEKLITALNQFFSDFPENQFFLMGQFLSYSPVEAKARVEEKYKNFLQNENPFTIVDISDLKNPQDKNLKKEDLKKILSIYTAQKIHELKQKYNLSYSDFAVLIEKRNFFDSIYPIFNQYQIPYFFYKQKGLFLSKAAKNLLVLLETLLDMDTRFNRLGFLTSFLGESINHVYWGDIDLDKQEFFFKLARLAKQRNWAEFFSMLSQSTVWYYLKNYYPEELNHQKESYRQILELAQEFAFKKDCHIRELIEYLQRLAISSDQEYSEDFYRIENKDAVKIITIHQSKGLEFPFVFCFFDLNKKYAYEFPTFIKKIQGKEIVTKILLTKSEENKNEVREKIHQEDRRLIYVALTRAKYGLWTFVLEPKKDKKGNPSIESHTLQNYWEKLKKQNLQSYIKIEKFMLPEENQIKFSQFDEQKFCKKMVSLALPKKEIWYNEEITKLKEEVYSNTFSVHSYSSLAKDKEIEFSYIEEEDYGEETSVLEEEEKILALPHGKKIGSFLHEILERIPFSFFKNRDFYNIWEELSQNIDHPINSLLYDMLKKYNFLPIEKNLSLKNKIQIIFQNELVKSMVKESLLVVYNTLKAKLPSLNISLSDLEENQFLREVGFLYLSKTSELEKVRINQDYIKGNMDLVFIHKNKIYFADYKSNNVPVEKIYQVNDELYSLQQTIYEKAINLFANWKNCQYGGWFYIYLRLTKPNSSRGIISKIV